VILRATSSTRRRERERFGWNFPPFVVDDSPLGINSHRIASIRIRYSHETLSPLSLLSLFPYFAQKMRRDLSFPRFSTIGGSCSRAFRSSIMTKLHAYTRAHLPRAILDTNAAWKLDSRIRFNGQIPRRREGVPAIQGSRVIPRSLRIAR